MNQDIALKEIAKKSTPLRDSGDLSSLINSIKDKQVVMLGEATHGTAEFYEWRDRITQVLIEEHGFNFVAVEGDWPACQEIHRHIVGHGEKTAHEALSHFSRWPTWMWGNTQMLQTLEWMRDWNKSVRRPVGFHGLDIYSLYESLDEVVRQVSDIDPRLGNQLKEAYECFGAHRHDEAAYVRSLIHVPDRCKEEVARALSLMQQERHREEFFDAVQNARIIKNAELYYRTLAFSRSDESWNIRDQHMMETLEMLLSHYGRRSKAIVWAHNTHIGDYRGTDMLVHGQVNLGGLARERLGHENVALVGMSTYQGRVTASHAWDGPIEIMNVPEAKMGSVEAKFHSAIPLVGCDDYYVMLTDVEENSPLLDYKGHRAIGVVYHSTRESRGNYVPTALARRYDALIFINETSALMPLGLPFNDKKLPDTYPFGSRY